MEDFREVTEDKEKNADEVTEAKTEEFADTLENDMDQEPVEIREADEDSASDHPTDDHPRGKERFCMICRRPESKVGRLIEMPGGLCCCNDCMQRSFDQVQSSMDNQGMNLQDLFGNFPGNIGVIDLASLTGGSRPRPNKKKQKAAAADAEQKAEEKKPMTMKDVPAPHIMKAKLDEYVIGQEQAKKYMSVAVYNHYKRILSNENDTVMGDVQIQKSNMLMIGPTGSGKTYLVQTLARLLDVPLAMTDATSLTEAGYIGDDIESVVSKLLAAADNDVERAEHGIIFIDEIDKIAKKKNTNQRDVSGEAVQQGLLKLLEGSEVEVPVGATSKNAMVPLQTVDTTNILFICGGAFPDLEDIIKERLTKTSSMGFQSELKDRFDDKKSLLSEVELEDIRSFGMIPEFLGRLPIVFALEPLSEEMLVQILKEPRNAILKQYEKLMALDEVKLTFEEDALRAIAKEAMERDTGARALRAILEKYMMDIMYEIPKDDNIGEVIITEGYINHTGGPQIIMRGAAEIPALEEKQL